MASLGIGEALKEERLRQNRDRDEISRLTCIAPRFIEAIEEGDFSRLPAIVFTRGFVRQYSTALNLDPEPLLAALPKPDIASAPFPDPPPEVRRKKWDPRVTSALQTTLLLTAAIGAGTLAWARFNPHAEEGSYFSLNSWRVREVSMPSQLTLHAAAPAPIPESPPTTPPAETPADPVEVTVAARAASWVQITADGKTTFSGVLNASEVRTAGASGSIKVVAGNAGAVDISLNGKKLDALGSAGQVRSVTLTPDGPLPGAQTPQPAPPSSGQP